MTEKLISRIDETEPTALEDLLLILAKNVEDALVASGAEPGEDYQRLDLFKLALPFAVEVFRKNDEITFTAEYF